ncbi:MAG: hypothetical protein PHR81_02120 [Bacteroidales bacterium]|nr:hypothetical protein [Bacteroidales bacterium]
MYDSILASVLWYLSWPALIFICYLLIRKALKHFENKYVNEK